MMIPRTASAKLMEMSEAMPVVTVYGPRQSGKTTLVKQLFPSFAKPLWGHSPQGLP